MVGFAGRLTVVAAVAAVVFLVRYVWLTANLAVHRIVLCRAVRRTNAAATVAAEFVVIAQPIRHRLIGGNVSGWNRILINLTPPRSDVVIRVTALTLTVQRSAAATVAAESAVTARKDISAIQLPVPMKVINSASKKIPAVTAHANRLKARIALIVKIANVLLAKGVILWPCRLSANAHLVVRIPTVRLEFAVLTAVEDIAERLAVLPEKLAISSANAPCFPWGMGSVVMASANRMSEKIAVRTGWLGNVATANALAGENVLTKSASAPRIVLARSAATMVAAAVAVVARMVKTVVPMAKNVS